MKKLTKAKKLTLYVVFSIGITVLYSIAEFIVSTITGIAHDQLTSCVYLFFAGEVVSCALIKIFNIKKGE